MTHFAVIENAWLEPPQQLPEAIYNCELCAEAVCAGDPYIELDGLIICAYCLDGLTARELAVEVLNNKIITAG
ncbi:hypothetical protein [Phascolarctobacterium sp.]